MKMIITKTKNVSLKDYISKRYKTREAKERLDKERMLARIALSIAELRQRQGLSQAGMAKLLHRKQQYISRIEQPTNKGVTLNTLTDIAEAFNKKLIVKFV